MKLYDEILNKINKNKTRKNFLIYTYVGLIVSLMNIFFVWLLIDVFHVNTLLSTSLVVGFLFLIKFAIYKKTGFTE